MMFYKKWLQKKQKQINVFRDTNYIKAIVLANEWIQENNINVIDIEFNYPFIVIKYWE